MTDIETWGPVFWWIIHCIAGHFPEVPKEEDRKAFQNWIENLPRLLPCGYCGIHLEAYLKANPIYEHTKSKAILEEYIYNLHEDVNKRNKKAQKHTLQEIRSAFKQGQPWKEFGGYPIKSSPKLTSIDPNIMLKNFASGSGVFSSSLSSLMGSNDNSDSTTVIAVSVTLSIIIVALIITVIILALRGSPYSINSIRIE